MHNQRRLAETNMRQHLMNNPYPGRGLIVGMDEAGTDVVQVYWIMGRSPNSRNRVFKRDCGRVFTEFADPSAGGDPSLVIYNAMREGTAGNTLDGFLSYFVVSNGRQTDDIIAISRWGTLDDALTKWTHEPDEPHYTPRISARCTLGGPKPIFELSMLRRSPWGNDSNQFGFKTTDIAPGFGYCVTTYAGDGNPLPSFQGDPLLVLLKGTNAVEIASNVWACLNVKNAVALVVKRISVSGQHEPEVEIINAYEQPSAPEAA